MSGRKRKKISCPFLSSKKPKRWKSDGTEEFGVERALHDRGSYYDQDECTFCPTVFHLFASSEHSEHWLARSACWPTCSPACLFHLKIFPFWLLEAHPRRPGGYWPERCDTFGRKFTSRADEALGTYSYRTTSRRGRIPTCWLGRKIFFCPISDKV